MDNRSSSRASSDSLAERSAAVKACAADLGFDACAVAAATAADPDDWLGRWLALGYHADMDWMARTKAVRQDVCAKLPGAKAVVVVARNYHWQRPEEGPGTGRVAAYAWGRDYHKVLRKPLRALAQSIEALEPGTRCYASVDTGPVLERTWAERAGLASIGKNGLALRRDLGSWFFLATVITTVELAADARKRDLCGTCRRCLDACPTSAIVEPGIVDSNRCISYHTIENRGDIPETLHPAHGNWVFGCDVCQEVCPWNRFARQTDADDFAPRPGHANPSVDGLLAMDEAIFNAEFAGSPLRRAKLGGIQRNARIAQANLALNPSQTPAAREDA